MESVIVAGVAVVAIAFLAVFFVELCKEKHRTSVGLILAPLHGLASGKIRSNLLVLPTGRAAFSIHSGWMRPSGRIRQR